MADTLERLKAALADRYRIEREIGSGGMATVYLAEDLKHHHSVALKVLRPELTAVLGPERFLREIEITRKLTHPFILPIHDSGSAGEFLYYVMPYVEGESLRTRLDREKQLPVKDAVQITREVADALEYAHGQDVVHRDIKPENILLEAGHAVVADFGIARAIHRAGGEKLTSTGVMLGTPTYMSPEQAGDGDQLDGRSDLYSLGCVLHEMLAGQPPYTGPTAESIVHQHLSASIPDVTALRPKAPQELRTMLQRALAKAPADRFATGMQFGEALESLEDEPDPPTIPVRRIALAILGVTVIVLGTWAWWTRAPDTPPPPAKKAWVLVAEFDGPPGDSSLTATIRDLVSAALDQSQVVATVPADQIILGLELAGKPANARLDPVLARELAERHSVRTVVEGRIGRIGGGYSIKLQVMDVDSSKAVVTVSGTAKSEEDLIATVERVSRQLRQGLGENWRGIQATRPLAQEMTPSLEAFRLSRRAQQLNDSGDIRGAIATGRQVLAIDPDYAEAWRKMAEYFWNVGEPDSFQVAIERALSIPERLSRYARGMAEAQIAYDPAVALAVLDRLAEEFPDKALIYNYRANAFMQLGRHEEVLADYRRVIEVSAFAPDQVSLSNLALSLLRLQRVEEARDVARKLTGPLASVTPVWVALAANEWAEAESLGTALENNLRVSTRWRMYGPYAVAVGHAVRGETRAADDALLRGLSLELASRRPYRMILSLLLARAAGRSPPPFTLEPDTTARWLIGTGLWAAASGDRSQAQELLRRARARPRGERVGLSLLESWIAANEGRWEQVIAILGAPARQGLFDGRDASGARAPMSWLVAEGFERLDRPDSAAVYYEQALNPYGLPVHLGRGILFSFAHQRLVLLYARMGRLEDARRHYDIFRATFTRPDPELVHLIEEARAALETAEAMAQPG